MNQIKKVLVLYYALWVIILYGLYGTFDLVREEWITGTRCPHILYIPACYIIFFLLILAGISHAKLFKDRSLLYFFGVGTALSIATFASIGNYYRWIECPISEGGIPMCYLSFVLFFLLLSLKLIHIRMARKKQ